MYAGDERTIHTFEWELIVNEDLASEIWNPIAETYSKRTALKDAAFLRGLLRSCVKSGLLTYEEYVDARAFVTRGLDELPPVGRYLSPEDIHAIVKAIQSEPNQTFRIRDSAILLCMASTGARRSEIVNIQMTNVHLDEQRIVLSQTKSGKTRDSWLHQAAVTALRAWIDHADLCTYLFPPLSRTGRVMPGRMGSHQIWKIVRRRAEQAAITGVTPHDLRRFVVGTLLDTTNDLALTSKMVGHANPNMTAKYDRRPASKKREAVDTLPLPMVLAESKRPRR